MIIKPKYYRITSGEKMKYNLYDKEFEVFNMIIDLPIEEIQYTQKDELELFNNMKDVIYWKDNTKERPDIINDKYKTMIECMQINDYTKNGQINNYAKDNNEKIKEIDKAMNLKHTFPNLKSILISNEVPQEYCSIDNYKKMIHKVIGKHIGKIQYYREKYNNYELVFLIIDLTETNYGMELQKNAKFATEVAIYHPIIDEEVMSVFLDKDVDYILWYRPFQQLSTINKLAIINNKRLSSFVNEYRRKEHNNCEN